MSLACGVGTEASIATPSKLSPCLLGRSPRESADSGVSVLLLTLGVGNEVKPLSSMGRADAVCSQYRRRNGVVLRFQVSTNKVEPAKSNCRMRLLSKDDWRAALADDGIPDRPEVTIIIKPLAFARLREGWAGAASGPDGSIVGPPGLSEAVGPRSDAGEEMVLRKSKKVCGGDIFNAPFVNFTGRYHAGEHQVAQPLRGVGIKFVVVGSHFCILSAT